MPKLMLVLADVKGEGLLIDGVADYDNPLDYTIGFHRQFRRLDEAP